MIKKKLVTSILAGVALAAGASISHAGGVATSYLNIKEFKFINLDTGTKLRVGDEITFVGQVTNDGDTNASLNGNSVSNDNSAPASPAGLDVDNSCVGACAYVENSFSYITQPTDATSTYAVGDVLLTGSSVNFPGLDAPDADAKLLAEVSLEPGDNIGTSSGNNVGVTGRIEFISSITAGVQVDYLADIYIRALLSADLNGLDSNASSSFSINILNTTTGASVLNYSPNAVNTGRSATIPGDDFEYSLTDYSDPDTAARTFQIVAGNRYQLTIDQAADANSTVVPLPTPLLLMGVGILALGSTRRLRKAS